MKLKNIFLTGLAKKPWQYFSLSIIWLWFAAFAFLPMCLVVLTSFLHHSPNELFNFPWSFTFEHYVSLNRPIYRHVLQQSFFVAGLTTFFCLILGYPCAYVLARLHGRIKNFLILLIIIPFWTSSLIRSYALIAILKTKGILNNLLLSLGIIDKPLVLLFTNTAVLLGLVYNLLPFMVLPIMTNVERLDNRLLDAARDLGAGSLTIFWRIIIPLTMPGIMAGAILVFLPAMTMFYIADILGGAKSIFVGNLIQNQFLIAQNWPMGSAISTLLTVLLIGLIGIYLWVLKGSKRREWLS